MTFKEELLDLLKKYPDVKEVHIKPKVTHDIEIVGEIPTASVVPEVAKPATVFEKAAMSAEETIAHLTSRAGIKVMQE